MSGFISMMSEGYSSDMIQVHTRIQYSNNANRYEGKFNGFLSSKCRAATS